MSAQAKSKIVIQYLLLLLFVIGTSYLVSNNWVQKSEEIPEQQKLIILENMTISEFSEANKLKEEVVVKTFELKTNSDFSKKINSFEYTDEQLTIKIDKTLSIEAEHGSKNWQKILVKFVLWIAFMVVVFILIKKGNTTPNQRKLLYLLSTIVFGIVLGADPSAMGTIKDAVVLFADKGVIFPPRMIALTVFLLMVVFGNKLFCGWGCQLGSLQDLIFRLNRSKKDRKGILKQFKMPFVFSNGFRILFFVAFTAIAFGWGIDIFEFMDPFKIFKPAKIELFGWIFLGAILLGSLFVYRPWCTLFCPFGLFGWFFEKLSFFKIKVNYDSCEGCNSCARACPTTAMDAILKQEKVIPDCFSCGTCMDTCPTKSISFGRGKREQPPEGKFDTKVKII